MGEFAITTMSFALISIITFISFQDVLVEISSIQPISSNLDIDTNIDPSKLKSTEEKIETKLELSEYYKTLQTIEDSVKALESDLIEVLDKYQKKTSGAVGKLQPDLATIDKAKQTVTKKYSYKVLSDYDSIHSKFRYQDNILYGILTNTNTMINKLKSLKLRLQRFLEENSHLTQVDEIKKSVSELEKKLKEYPTEINKQFADLKSQIEKISKTLDFSSKSQELNRIKADLEKLDWSITKTN